MIQKNDILKLEDIEGKFKLPTALVIGITKDADLQGFYLDLLIDGLILHAFAMETVLDNESGLFGFFVSKDNFWGKLTFKIYIL